MQPQTQPPAGVFHLPAQLTAFIGRADEVQAITRLLVDPACRLLTLVGVGGIGKTRLAGQVAANLSTAFADGIYFVPLQAVESAYFFLCTLADALNLPLTGPEDPVTQLLIYLRDKEILLVLDNFEQLLSAVEAGRTGSAAILSQILAAAAGAKALITSREVLNLQEEWLYPVQGLPFPPAPRLSAISSAESEAIEMSPAVHLFVERARRVRRDFSLADEQADVVRICQLTEGVPLAIELAAAWTKTLRCADIVAEIQRNLNFLATSLYNVPERQRSVRATFDYCWQRLDENERRVFQRLSIFRSGFQRQAAKQVAGASLPLLASLVDKSLLRWLPEGRYYVHALLRQYAAEQLVRSPADVNQIYDKHCAYYADFLHQRQADLASRRQFDAAAEIEAELENIRAAWQWAVVQAKLREISRSAHVLLMFYQLKSRYREGLDAFTQALTSLQQQPSTEAREKVRAVLLLDQGWLYIRLGQLPEAKAVLEQSRALYAHLNLSPPPGHSSDPLIALGVIATIFGDYAEAAQLAEAARQANEKQNHRGNLAVAWLLLTRVSLAYGDYGQAQQYAQQAWALYEQTGARWMMAYSLNDLGMIAAVEGDFIAAKVHFQASYAIRESFNDLEGMALALNHLGKLAARQEAYVEAREHHQHSLTIYREINDRGGLAASLDGLGTVACALGDYPAARQYFHQALDIAAAIHFVPLVLSILTGIGELLLSTRQTERGAAVLAFVDQHPASNYETKTKAQALLARYNLAPIAPIESGSSADLTQLIEAVQKDLVAPGQEDEMQRRLGKDTKAPPQPLVEALTSRELDILRLIAAGHSNPEIATALTLTVGTVKAHTNHIYGKLNTTNRVQAVNRARELGLL